MTMQAFCGGKVFGRFLRPGCPEHAEDPAAAKDVGGLLV